MAGGIRLPPARQYGGQAHSQTFSGGGGGGGGGCS